MGTMAESHSPHRIRVVSRSGTLQQHHPLPQWDPPRPLVQELDGPLLGSARSRLWLQLAGAFAGITLAGFTFVGIILTAQQWNSGKKPAVVDQPSTKPPPQARATPRAVPAKQASVVTGRETGPVPRIVPEFLDTLPNSRIDRPAIDESRSKPPAPSAFPDTLAPPQGL